MKKRSITVLTASVIILVMIVSVSIAVASGDLAFWSDDGTAERQDINKTYTVELAGRDSFSVIYDMSRAVGEEIADIYKDESGNDYIYKNGKLMGFYSNEINNPVTDCDPVGKETAEKIAVTFLASFTDNVKEYTLRDFSEKENYGQYYFTFARKLGGIFTEEYAKISVMYDGRVKSVSVFNDGNFDDVNESIVDGINEDFLNDYAKSEIEKIYPNETAEFEMTRYSLEKGNGCYYISIYGDLGGNAESVRYYLED